MERVHQRPPTSPCCCKERPHTAANVRAHCHAPMSPTSSRWTSKSRTAAGTSAPPVPQCSTAQNVAALGSGRIPGSSPSTRCVLFQPCSPPPPPPCPANNKILKKKHPNRSVRWTRRSVPKPSAQLIWSPPQKKIRSERKYSLDKAFAEHGGEGGSLRKFINGPYHGGCSSGGLDPSAHGVGGGGVWRRGVKAFFGGLLAYWHTLSSAYILSSLTTHFWGYKLLASRR